MTITVHVLLVRANWSAKATKIADQAHTFPYTGMQAHQKFSYFEQHNLFYYTYNTIIFVSALKEAPLNSARLLSSRYRTAILIFKYSLVLLFFVFEAEYLLLPFVVAFLGD